MEISLTISENPCGARGDSFLSNDLGTKSCELARPSGPAGLSQPGGVIAL